MEVLAEVDTLDEHALKGGYVSRHRKLIERAEHPGCGRAEPAASRA